MTEELEEIVFFDTNTLLLNPHWDLYANELHRFKEKSNHLEDNHKIDAEKLEKATKAAQIITDLFDSNPSRVRITKGVGKQALLKIDDIVGNIQERRKSFFYFEFNRTIPVKLKQDSKEIFPKLINYRNILEKLRGNIENSRYQRPKEEIYQTLFHFLEGLHYFFKIGKENQGFDYNTDKGLNLAALYETLKGNKVKVYSNDKDVIEAISAAYVLLDKIKMLMLPEMARFYENPIEICKLGQSDPHEQISVDIQEEGQRIVRTLPGGETYLNETEKKIYNQTAGKFALFLETMIDEFKENFQQQD